jgi:hypothetical protein
MRSLAGIFTIALMLFVAAACSKKDTTPASVPSVVNYEVAFSISSLQSKYLFIYTDINGAHTDTIYTQTDSIVTQVPSTDMQVLQKIQCLDTLEPDVLTIKAYMNGSSISNTKYKTGTGPLVAGVQLQSLQ